MFWCLKKNQNASRPSEHPSVMGSLVGADRPPKQAMPVARQEDLDLCVLWWLSLSLQSVPRCKKSGIVCLGGRVDIFVLNEKSERA